MREQTDSSRTGQNRADQNRADQKRADQKRADQKRADLRQAYARAFEGEAGRLILADISRQGFLRETSFSPDPQRAAFNEGRRSLALYIGRMIEGTMPQRQASRTDQTDRRR
ncbi:MAG: hypothetical protein CVU73_09390 [Deltaproteobacteria bacterium HGW-Deltaproteobacteria-8]|nr:MAG: hypothetical protein CVU73_09390 [Deltaproteobacteria bacterium HGW-Deltaproteobacteria-8]